jgi:hypothetical protein
VTVKWEGDGDNNENNINEGDSWVRR